MIASAAPIRGRNPPAAHDPLLHPAQRPAQAAQGRRHSMQQTIAELITATDPPSAPSPAQGHGARPRTLGTPRPPSVTRLKCETMPPPAPVLNRLENRGRAADGHGPRTSTEDRRTQDHRRGGAGLCRPGAGPRQRPCGMTRWLHDFRLLPLVLLAIGCLFALKTFGLFSEGGYTLGQRLGSGNTLVVTTVPTAPVAELRSPAVTMEIAGVRPQRSWMQEVFNYPGGDITGSVAAPKPKEPEKPEPPVEQAPESKAAAGIVITQDQPRQASAGERALLERLQSVRRSMRGRASSTRESMLKAAEKKLQTQNAWRRRQWRRCGGRRLGQWPSARTRKRATTPVSRASSLCTRPAAEGGRQDIRIVSTSEC